METTVELVTTKSYTALDLAQLLGEGKDLRSISVAVNTGGQTGTWSRPIRGEEFVLRIIIREPAEVDTEKK